MIIRIYKKELTECMGCPDFRFNLFNYESGCMKFKLNFKGKFGDNYHSLSRGLFAKCKLDEVMEIMVPNEKIGELQ